MKFYATLFVLACWGTATFSMESHRERQERQMYTPHLSAPTSVRQRQENAIAVTAAAVKPAGTPAQPKR